MDTYTSGLAADDAGVKEPQSYREPSGDAVNERNGRDAEPAVPASPTGI